MGLFDGTELAGYVDAWRGIGFDASREMAVIRDWRQTLDPEETLRQLQVEYTRLFINAFPSIPAPPYSSMYLEGPSHPVVWGDGAAQATRLYEAAGLSLSLHFNDLPDHIAAELEFVAYLVTERQRRKGNNETTQRLARIKETFLTDHLFLWAPVFFLRVRGCTKAPFYRAVSELAERWIAWDGPSGHPS